MTFLRTAGVDFFSLIRATYQFIRAGEIISGGGTITMQVARNYVLTKEQTFERKLKEIFMAFKLDLSFSKEEIFELYVNQIFLEIELMALRRLQKFIMEKIYLTYQLLNLQ